MKYFIKDKDGNLVEATLEQIQDKGLELFNEDGEKVREAEAADPPPDPDDGVDKVVSSIQNIASTVDERLKAFEARLNERDKKVDEKISKAFPLGGGGGGGQTQVGDDARKQAFDLIGRKYDLRRQGANIQDKALHPMAHVTNPEVIDELKQYFGLIACMSSQRGGVPTALAMEARELFDKVYGGLDPETKTVVGDSGNTFPLPDIVHAEILAFARERSFILQYGRMVDMVSDKDSFPRETASASVAWGNTTSESEPTVDEFELSNTELSVYSAVRNTHLADSRSDIVSWLTANLGEAAGLELDNKAFNGAGTDSPFICSGILSAACGYSVTMASGSTSFSNLTSTHLSEMISKLDGMKKEDARYMMNGVALHYVRDLKDDNNRPIFTETVGGAIEGRIWGYPYSEVIKCPSTDAADTAFMAFGNPKYFAVGRRLDTAALDVNPYLLWTTNRTAYKLYQRWALGIALANGFVRLLTASG